LNGNYWEEKREISAAQPYFKKDLCDVEEAEHAEKRMDRAIGNPIGDTEGGQSRNLLQRTERERREGYPTKTGVPTQLPEKKTEGACEKKTSLRHTRRIYQRER